MEAALKKKPFSLTLLKGKIKLPVRGLANKLGNLGTNYEENEKQCRFENLMFEMEEDISTFHSTGFETDADIDEVESVPVTIHKGFIKEMYSSENIAADDKRSDLEFELSQKVMNIDKLQDIANSGLPSGGGLRATTWKLLLGYLSPSRDLWERELADNRLKYATLKKELLLNPTEEISERKNEPSLSKEPDILLSRHEVSPTDHPLSIGKASIWHQYFKDSEIAEQIDRDLQRTHPDIKFFSGDSSLSRKHRQAMRNILLLFAKLNPAIGYVQGMNEVLAPLYFVFTTDSDEQNAVRNYIMF